MAVRLELIEHESGEVWGLESDETLLAGRNREADVILVDPDCSRRQFEIQITNDQVILSALSQSVPTFCDGAAVENRVSLKVGTVISVGRTRLEIRVASSGHSSMESETPFRADLPSSDCWNVNVQNPVSEQAEDNDQVLLTQAIRIEKIDESPSSDMFGHFGAAAKNPTRAVKVTGDIRIPAKDEAHDEVDHQADQEDSEQEAKHDCSPLILRFSLLARRGSDERDMLSGCRFHFSFRTGIGCSPRPPRNTMDSACGTG